MKLTLGLFPCPHYTFSGCLIYPLKGRIYVRSDSKVQHPLAVQPISSHFQRWHVGLPLRYIKKRVPLPTAQGSPQDRMDPGVPLDAQEVSY